MTNTPQMLKELSLSMLFITCVLCANFLSSKPTFIGPFLCSAGIVAYPLSYLLASLSSEWFGFEKARQMITLSMIACMIASIALAAARQLPPSNPSHDLYADMTQAILWGSLIGIYCGDCLNAYIVAKLKTNTTAPFWLRALLAMCAGEFLSGLLFTVIAYAQAPAVPLLEMSLGIFILKLLIMLICLSLLQVGQLYRRFFV